MAAHNSTFLILKPSLIKDYRVLVLDGLGKIYFM